MNDLAHWIRDYLVFCMTGIDLTAASLSWRAMELGDLASLYDVDRRVHALKTAREEREASRMLGDRRLRITSASLREPAVRRALADLDAGKWRAHNGPVFGMLARTAGMDERDALTCFAYHTLAGMTSAAIRLRLCGQQAAQDIMTRLAPAVDAAAQEAAAAGSSRDMGASGPLAEICQMRHERAEVRLFMS